MSDDEHGPDSFEERLRQIAREVSESVERITQLDIEHIAEAIGVDPDRARELADTAGRWLSGQGANFGGNPTPWGPRAESEKSDPPARGGGPHPLDLPTEEQGLALSALDSGRWTVEPGSSVLKTHGEGPGPSDPIGLVGELRARDWIAPTGEVTLVGRNALRRWLDSANSPD